MNSRSLLRTLPPLTVLLALAACAGAATRFHTLDPAPPAARAAADPAYVGPPVRLDAVHIPAIFDRPELVRQTSANTLAVSDLDHWGAPLGELMRRTLTQNLAVRLPAGRVVFPDAPKPADARGLVVDILALTPSEGEVRMDASWTLLPARRVPATPLAALLHQRTVRLSTPASARDVSGNAAELSALLGQLADQIALDLGRASMR